MSPGSFLQLAVEGRDEPAAGGVEAGLHCRRLTEVAPQADQAHMIAVPCRPLAQAPGRAVVAAVVDADRLPAPAVRGEPLVDAGEERGDVVALAIQRDHDGQRWGLFDGRRTLHRLGGLPVCRTVAGRRS